MTFDDSTAESIRTGDKLIWDAAVDELTQTLSSWKNKSHADLDSAVHLALIKSANTFKPGKGKFMTLARRIATNALIDEKRHNKNSIEIADCPALSITNSEEPYAPTEHDPTLKQKQRKDTVATMIDPLSNHLEVLSAKEQVDMVLKDKRCRPLMLLMLSGLTRSQAARKLGITRKNAFQIVRKARSLLQPKCL